MSIHKLAVIDSSATIDSTVKVGPFATIGPNVKIGAGSVIESYAIVHRNTVLGENNLVSSFVSLGGASQSKHDRHDDASSLIIGSDNSFHEYCCINRGSVHASGKTEIGDNNIFMAYTHVAHDCIIHNNVVLVNQATLAGHVRVNSNALLGYAVAVRQFCIIGQNAFISEGATVVKDVMPCAVVRGNPTRVVGVNKVGLARLEIAASEVEQIQECFRIVFRRNLTCEQAVAEINALASETDNVRQILTMLNNSERGLVR